MNKPKTVFICQGCGFRSPKWLGRCPACGEWNTFVEEIEEEAGFEDVSPAAEPVLYKDIKETAGERLLVGIDDFNKVLGGGIVPGSAVLVGGEPGIGKSTLLLQVSRDLAERGETVLYVSGEESLEQVKLRGSRLGLTDGRLYLLAETNLERILSQADRLRPAVLIVDSIQTSFSAKLSSGPGTISQVREAANRIFRFAKLNQIPVFLVGHITKEGSIAGPKTLEHIVDVVLLFEGERDHSHRVLRALKNRFGPVSELAVFEMTSGGLKPIINPSEFFLRERQRGEPGSAVVCTIKGTRPVLAEIQALVSPTLFTGNPRRISIGLDHFRTSMLLALAEKKLGYGFAGEDIYMNVAGGMSIDEPAADMAVVAAVVSSVKNIPLPKEMAFFGEIGLSGEMRAVSQPLTRIKEAHLLGFESVVLPAGNLAALDKKDLPPVECLGAATVRQGLNFCF